MSKLLEQFNKKQLDKSHESTPFFKAGDTVRVSLLLKEGANERIQSFEGVCIYRSGTGLSETFLLRKIASNNEGVERLFPLHSKLIKDIKVVRRGKVRQSRIFYLRELTGKAARIKEIRLDGEKAKKYSQEFKPFTQKQEAEPQPQPQDQSAQKDQQPAPAQEAPEQKEQPKE